jgi:hypothetical protein
MEDDVKNSLAEVNYRLFEAFRELAKSLKLQTPPESLMLDAFPASNSEDKPITKVF